MLACLYPVLRAKEETRSFEYSVLIIPERDNTDSPIADDDDDNHSEEED